MTRLALGVAYTGGTWQGWQSQPGGKTVQDRLESALSSFANHPVRVFCAGRTDAGVHALGQVVHFDTEATRLDQGWIRGVNALLPASIAVQWAVPVAQDFHARYAALTRRYDYVLFNHPVRSPHLHGRAGWIHTPLDLERMSAAAAVLVGSHDFSAFRSSECQAKSPMRRIDSVTLRQRGPMFVFSFCANAFLHHMVRNLVGSLVAVGGGKYDAAWLAEVLAGRDRKRAAPTFMPDGLYLTEVQYPEVYALPAAPHLDAVFPGLLS